MSKNMVRESFNSGSTTQAKGYPPSASKPKASPPPQHPYYAYGGGVPHPSYPDPAFPRAPSGEGVGNRPPGPYSAQINAPPPTMIPFPGNRNPPPPPPPPPGPSPAKQGSPKDRKNTGYPNPKDSPSPWKGSGGRCPPPMYPPPPYNPDAQSWSGHEQHAPPPGYPYPPPPPYGSTGPPIPPPPPIPTPHDSRYWSDRSAPPPPPPPPPLLPRTSSSKPAEVDGREGATSPSQIESSHRDEVQHMGCTCKKTRCLKLYCQCFGIKIYCGPNCRCVSCFNTRKHEKARKDAMRTILSRNPSAFDTKFRKSLIAQTAETDKALAHRTGCKCRKSACMKKYCECYAGNVKCGTSCRCMGCKNTGNTSNNMYDRDSHYEGPRFPVQHPPPAHVMRAASRGGKRAGEPWVAAQNLTFLKHGSPTSEQQERKRRAVGESGDITSMPSLASSSEGTSPSDATKKHGFVTEEPGINSLMMAAYAMTEFGQGSGRYQKDDNKKQAVVSPKKYRKSRASSATNGDAAVASEKDETTETEPVQEI